LKLYLLITVVAAGDYLSTHMPEEGPAGDSGAVHAITRGVTSYDCQELGHVIATRLTAHIVLRVRARQVQR